ncbi:MAG: penicillin acylase family protein, partial [Rhodothermales bacterium]|nr:penicillin acylase family protein [Rhodothermales bacterium]
MDPAIEGEALFDDILYFYNAYRRSVRFQPEDLSADFRTSREAFERLASALPAQPDVVEKREIIGSNNWVTDGSLSRSGYPVMANDPHRTLAVPSLRYWTHLVAPGWNVIGGGEPEIPGISIGHNEHGAWGLTVFQTDGEDLYVYETHPDDPRRYRYGNGWEEMTAIADTIHVKDSAPVVVEHLYTRHGPVVYQNPERPVAYAVRAAWSEIGGAPYLASLRMNQARTWEEFREACRYSHIPGENMIWAGRDGTIGWQAVGIAPVRPNWSGLVPVPGDGRYEWDGYLDILEKPHEVNPPRGWIATANNELVPDDYPHRDAVGWEWSDPFRAHRAAEVLGSGQVFGLADHMQLQTDVLSIPARTLVPLLRPLRLTDPPLEAARSMLLKWDHQLHADSGPAALYVLWERILQRAVPEAVASPQTRELLGGLALSAIIDHLTYPGPEFAGQCGGCNPLEGRDALLISTLAAAMEEAKDRMGDDPEAWRYGDFKHADIDHALLSTVTPESAERLDCCDLPRGGNSYTLNNTSGGDNQRAGATFRIIVDTGDWDASVGMNAPGQSGDPDSPFYDNLFEHWARDQFFPVYFSRELVEAAAVERTELLPEDRR